MLQTKLIDGTINITNPINFCADKDRHLLAIVKNTYSGRCYKGAFIESIKEVLSDSGSCHIVRTNGSGHGYIDVRFIADVHVFNRWDILTGVKVISNQQMIVGEFISQDAIQDASQDASQDAIQDASQDAGQDAGQDANKSKAVVSIIASKASEGLAVGQKIAVRIVLSLHSPMQPLASVVGTLLVCDQKAPVYKLRGMLDQTSLAELTPMMSAILSELKLRDEIIKTRKADLWFFEILLYAYTGPAELKDQKINAWDKGPSWQGPGYLHASGSDTAITMMSILDIVRRVSEGTNVSVTGFWSRSLSIYRSSPLVAMASSDVHEQKAEDGIPRAVFAEFLKNILDFLVATRELISVYNTKALIDSHFNIWTIMRAAQRRI